MAGKELVNYGIILNQLKVKIKAAKIRAALTVNNELLKIYWEIGDIISSQEKDAGWGNKVIDKLATDLKIEFPGMKGLSPRNLRYMRDFSIAYPSFLVLQQPAANIQNGDIQYNTILQQAAAKLPWGHHLILLDRLKTPDERNFYIQKCTENGWSRNVMLHNIESGLYKRQGTLTHNFKETLPAHQNELTQQLFKDPYQFDFLMLGEEAKERDLEDALINHVTKLLLELGDGFAFMGRQRRFEAGGKDFFIDLLFYHTKMRRYIIIELKIGEFEPEYVSKMNLYLGLADDILKGEFDQPSIGLILCKTKNKIVAEYALRDTSKPIGIAEYKIAQMLPEDIKGELPSIEEIEQKLDEEIKEYANPAEERFEKLKEKIRKLKNEEIKNPVSFEHISSVFSTGLKPLYQKILNEMTRFEEMFVSKSIQWQCRGRTFNSLEDMESQWLMENKLKGRSAEINLFYHFYGFKQAGTEAFGCGFDLKVDFQDYWYGFSLVNHNDHRPFIKKLYHQSISTEEINHIIKIIYDKVMDDIDYHLERLEKEEIRNNE